MFPRINSISQLLRKIAKSNYWQIIFVFSKESGALQLFINKENLTSLQVEFLNHLTFYNSLFMDIALGEVNEIVLNNEIYEDAYWIYKNQKKDKRKKDHFVKNVENDRYHKQEILNQNQWVFTKVKGK